MNKHLPDIPRILVTALAMICCLATYAHFKVFAVEGNVTLKHGRETRAAVVDQEVSAADLFILGENSSVEILDTRDSKTYKISKPGEYTPSSIVFEARRQSVQTASAVNRNMRIGKTGSSDKPTVFLAKGKVTRALQNYDPHSDTLQIDNVMLGHYVKSMLKGKQAAFPVPVKSQRTPEGGLTLRLRNNILFPLYFNVLRVNPDDNSVALAEIGQPVGCYVLLPNQEITRAQLSDIDADTQYVVVMAHYYFEVDQLLDAINDETSPVTPPAELPVYMYSF